MLVRMLSTVTPESAERRLAQPLSAGPAPRLQDSATLIQPLWTEVGHRFLPSSCHPLRINVRLTTRAPLRWVLELCGRHVLWFRRGR